MKEIRKRIVTDERNQPVAVQIDYEDWLEIERRLAADRNGPGAPDLGQFAGAVRLSEDPLHYQQRIRGEWR